MPELTTKLRIKKPLGNETVSRAAFNENWDIIDANAQKNIIQSNTAPASPVLGDLWIDTSTTPNSLKKYNGTDWDIVGAVTPEQIGAVKNNGNVPSIQSGLDADKPIAGTVGRLYIATDTQVIYRDTGTAWQKVGAVKWGDIDGKPNVPNATTQDMTIYVDSATGSDSNPGTQTQPLKTIQAAINMIPQIVNHTVTIYVNAGTYNEDIGIIGFSGKGLIMLVGANQVATTHTISSLLIQRCTTYVACSGFNITTITKEAVTIEACIDVNIQYMNITQTSTYAGILVLTSLVRVANNQISNRNVAITAGLASTIFSLNNSGTGNNEVFNAKDAGKIGLWETQPSGTTTISTAGGGQVLS